MSDRAEWLITQVNIDLNTGFYSNTSVNVSFDDVGEDNIAATFVNVYRQDLTIPQKLLTMCHNQIDCG